MPVKLGLRAVFAEVDSEGALPKTVFDLPDTNTAKQEALSVCRHISQKVFGHE